MDQKELSTAREFSIITYLAAKGHTPLKHRGKEAYFLSPLPPEEKTPSFSVHLEKNSWYDHRSGKGGNLIDLVIEMGKPVAEAVADILAVAGEAIPGTSNAIPKVKKTKAKINFHVAPLTSAIDLDYLESRKIDTELIFQNPHHASTLLQCTYNLAGEDKKLTFFSLAWRNESGGYELRNKNFKGAHGTKDYTFIPSGYGFTRGVAVFEGFMNYLSALTYYKRNSLNCDVVVFNSTSMLAKALPLLKKYPKIFSFLDRNAAGRRCQEKLAQELSATEIPIEDKSTVYEGHEDFNDLLTGKKFTPKSKSSAPVKGKIIFDPKKSKYCLWVVWRQMQFDKQGIGYDTMTYYSFCNTPEGKEQLERERKKLAKQGLIKLSRLSEIDPETRQLKILSHIRH